MEINCELKSFYVHSGTPFNSLNGTHVILSPNIQENGERFELASVRWDRNRFELLYLFCLFTPTHFED